MIRGWSHFTSLLDKLNWAKRGLVATAPKLAVRLVSLGIYKDSSRPLRRNPTLTTWNAALYRSTPFRRPLQVSQSCRHCDSSKSPTSYKFNPLSLSDLQARALSWISMDFVCSQVVIAEHIAFGNNIQINYKRDDNVVFRVEVCGVGFNLTPLCG